MGKMSRDVARAAFLVAGAVGLLMQPEMNRACAAAVPQRGSQGSGFLGAWCAQGDPTKHASISSNGVFFNLTNESGSTSIGHMDAGSENVLVADEWQFVQGTLSSNGNQINWSNGTFWARCNNGGGGGGGRRPNIDGTWYRGGDHSQACYIKQRGKNLKLTNEGGSTATGSFDDKRHVTTSWNGTTIGGTIARGGDRIDWDNGTYWTR
jgi:hypothetical protein